MSESRAGATSRWRSVGLWPCTGAAAGFAGWLILENLSSVFRLPPDIARLNPPFSDSAVERRVELANQKVQMQNTALGLGLCGFVLGGLLGIGVGRCIGRGAAWLPPSLAGALGGGLLGALGGACEVGILPSLRLQPALDDAQRAILIHAVGWGLLALGAGLGIGTVLPRQRLKTALRLALLAVIGGVIGTAIYTPAAAIAFPMLDSAAAIPAGTWNRLLWAMLPSVLIALFAGPAALRAAETTPTESAIQMSAT